MESLATCSKEPQTVKKTKYYALLLLCLFICIGICCAVLPVLPPGPGFNESSQGHLTFCITRIILVVVIIVIEIVFYGIIRKKDHFHRKQEVFWPLQCRHCARAVGVLPQHKYQTTCTSILFPNGIGASEQDKFNIHHDKRRRSLPGEMYSGRSIDISKDYWNHQSNTNSKVKNSSNRLHKEKSDQKLSCSLPVSFSQISRHRDHHDVGPLSGEIINSKCDPSFKDSSLTRKSSIGVDFTEREDKSHSFSRELKGSTIEKLHHHHTLYKKPHKSLLNIFIVFGIICVINIPLQILGVLLCLFQNNNSLLLVFSLLSQALLDISFTILILEGVLFFSLYYDAVFIDQAKYSYSIAFVFACGIWIAVLKILYPLSDITNSPYGKLEYPCKYNGTFGDIILNNDKMLTPFYAECGIIGCGLMWQIWSAFLPQSCLFLSDTEPKFDSLRTSPTNPFFKRVLTNVKNFCRKCTVSTRGERQRLLPDDNNDQPRRLLLRLAVIVSIVTGMVYFGLSWFIQSHESTELTENTKAYLNMGCEMAFYLPVIAMYRYQAFLTDSFSSFRLKMGVSYLHDLVESHDRILLLSCVGIFTLNIFRLIGSIGLLFHATSVQPDELSLACFTVIFSIFQLYTVWMMTSFLFIVQRQMMRGILSTQWTLVCLVYTIVLNATQWIFDSVNIDTWKELKNYYGDIPGDVMGIILEPISSLYGIHAAMVAMEAYKSILYPVKHNT